MSDTSQLKKSKRSMPKEQPPITPDDLLQMLQTMLNRLNDANIPGVKARRASIFHEGQQTAGIILTGCKWSDDGNLTLAAGDSVGNSGESIGNA